MKKAIVIYKTVSGFTKKYAEWIANDLKADIIEQKEANKNMLQKYDIIVYGGSLHAIGIIGLKKVYNLMKAIPEKKLVVYATGASPYNKKVIDDITKHNIQDDKTKLFYLRGGFDKNKLDFKNRIIMRMFISILRRKKNKSEDEEGMIQAWNKPVDFTDKKNIKELVSFVKKL
ncbi:flavodoxin [Candidatus Woesearchaeota archaeon]|nr:flavodoxin [Candidatus Woesearchaeota archaeon]